VYVQQEHTHRPEKTISKNKKKILKKTVQISPGRTKVGKNTTNKMSSSTNHGMQSSKSSKTLQSKSHEKITEQEKIPLQEKYK
jgi:hypothetical protein